MTEYLTQHFSMEELTASDYADRHGIDNTPPFKVRENLRYLAEKLEKVREIMQNRPIHVNSAYRSPMLNEAIGGSVTSAHMKGLAADITCRAFGDSYVVCMALKANRQLLGYDQLIREYGWVHIAFPEAGKTPRYSELTKRSASAPYEKGILA